MLIWSLLERIMRINEKREPYFSLELQSEICALVKELLSLCGEESRQEPKELALVRKMIYCIQQHYSEKITVSDIAASASVNRNQCFRLFHKTMCISPQQYLEQFRISKSVEMMQEMENMAEIAQACGFCSQSYYTKVFKEYYRLTPLQFKKKLEEK